MKRQTNAITDKWTDKQMEHIAKSTDKQTDRNMTQIIKFFIPSTKS